MAQDSTLPVSNPPPPPASQSQSQPQSQSQAQTTTQQKQQPQPQPQQSASSPTTTSPNTSGQPSSSIDNNNTLPLDHPSRITPIHPLLPTVLVTANATTTSTNPLTLQPFTEAELQIFNFEQFLSDCKHLSKPELEKLRDEAAKALKAEIDKREARVREIEKEIEEKEKIREVERKVYRKKMEGRKRGAGAGAET